MLRGVSTLSLGRKTKSSGNLKILQGIEKFSERDEEIKFKFREIESFGECFPKSRDDISDFPKVFIYTWFCSNSVRVLKSRQR